MKAPDRTEKCRYKKCHGIKNWILDFNVQIHWISNKLMIIHGIIATKTSKNYECDALYEMNEALQKDIFKGDLLINLMVIHGHKANKISKN